MKHHLKAVMTYLTWKCTMLFHFMMVAVMSSVIWLRFALIATEWLKFVQILKLKIN